MWVKMADLALAVLLERLSIAATELLVDRIQGGNGYIAVDDGEVFVQMGRVAKDNFHVQGLGLIPEIEVTKTMKIRNVFEHQYAMNDEEMKVEELAAEYLLLVNPLKSNLVSVLPNDPEMVMDKLTELGHKCVTMTKRPNQRKRRSLRSKYKPRRTLCQRAIHKIRKELTWQPELIRDNGVEKTHLPAVIIC